MKFLVPVIFSTKQANKAIMSLAQALGRANRGIGRFGLCYKLSALQNNLKSAYRYQLPESTISDHLNDCFGWMTEKRPYYKRFRCVNRKMAGRMSAKHYYKRGSGVPPTTHFVEHHDELAG